MLWVGVGDHFAYIGAVVNGNRSVVAGDWCCWLWLAVVRKLVRHSCCCCEVGLELKEDAVVTIQMPTSSRTTYDNNIQYNNSVQQQQRITTIYNKINA